MFILHDESKMNLNEYAQLCFDQHYKGYNLKDIESFLNEIVLSGHDPMREQRRNFVEQELMANEKELVSDRIFQSIKNDLSIKV